MPARPVVLDRVSFENFKSLKAVTIELAPLTVLVGPNGSGKSSVLLGMHLPSQTGVRRSHHGSTWGRFSVTQTGELWAALGDVRVVPSFGCPSA